MAENEYPPMNRILSLSPGAVIPFLKRVAVSTQDNQSRLIPLNGTVQDVVMVFPAGCHQLVEVRLVYSPKGGSRDFIIPTVDEAFIALDDTIVVFHPQYPVKAPGSLEVEWWNYDTINTHSVPVVITLVPVGLERES